MRVADGLDKSILCYETKYWFPWKSLRVLCGKKRIDLTELQGLGKPWEIPPPPPPHPPTHPGKTNVLLQNTNAISPVLDFFLYFHTKKKKISLDYPSLTLCTTDLCSEVKPEPVRGHKGTFLIRLPQGTPEGKVQSMSPGMVLHDVSTTNLKSTHIGKKKIASWS